MVLPFDLHGRKAIKFSQFFSQFREEIRIGKKEDSRNCSAKSLIGILSLGIKKDESIIITLNSENDDIINKTKKELIGFSF